MHSVSGFTYKNKYHTRLVSLMCLRVPPYAIIFHIIRDCHCNQDPSWATLTTHKPYKIHKAAAIFMTLKGEGFKETLQGLPNREGSSGTELLTSPLLPMVLLTAPASCIISLNHIQTQCHHHAEHQPEPECALDPSCSHIRSELLRFWPVSLG